MNTIEDFKNAPVGATATNDLGHRALKTVDQALPWTNSQDNYLTHVSMADEGYTLDQPASAREALDCAWELAHEVKPGQIIPKGAQYLELYGSCVREYDAPFDIAVNPAGVPIRTVEPLQDPEPDWIDAPAVLAGFGGWRHDEREVFIPTGAPNRWTRANTDSTFHWNELRDVTPLYPLAEGTMNGEEAPKGYTPSGSMGFKNEETKA